MKNITIPNSDELLEVIKNENQPNGILWIEPKWLVREKGEIDKKFRFPNKEELDLINSVLYLCN
jgi:hypothetical protein